MNVDLVKYREPLTKDELVFLRRKEAKERKQLYSVMSVFMVMCFICPFATAWVKAAFGDERAFSYFNYFLGVGFLLCFSGFCILFSYYRTLHKVVQDIKHGTKTIERTYITRKQYMPAGNAFYFYISSAIKLSIEVEEVDFRRLKEGDELSITYTSYSNFYLGYF